MMANSPTVYRPQFTTTNIDMAYADFLANHPTFDADNLAELRDKEYSRLDTQQQVYLDYTGGGLYGDSQLESHLKILREGVFGNPHSSNPTSKASTELDEHSREFVLEYFNASPDEYVAIFTQNASGALKLVGESYPFTPKGHYLLTFDNHNSVNGIREFARAKGATLTYAPVLPPDLRIDAAKLDTFLEMAEPAENNLFAYPAQSNFSGVQHDLEWIAKAQSKGWDVLLDAAAFVPTNCLDLSRWHPDFVTLSFYKMFGYPTGIGCLIARKSALEKLKRPWFAGGTITIASVQGDGHYMAEDEAGFEDGTIDYLNWPAVEIGLKHLKSIGIDTVHERVTCLTDWIIDNLMALYHSNRQPLIHLYGPANTEMRGGTITVNFRDKNGKLYEFQEIEARANQVNISLRTGCFCNPGAGENALGITKEDLVDYYGRDERMTFEQFVQAMHGRGEDAVGAVRISVGLATNFADIYRFMEFAESFIDAEAE